MHHSLGPCPLGAWRCPPAHWAQCHDCLQEQLGHLLQKVGAALRDSCPHMARRQLPWKDTVCPPPLKGMPGLLWSAGGARVLQSQKLRQAMSHYLGKYYSKRPESCSSQECNSLSLMHSLTFTPSLNSWGR